MRGWVAMALLVCGPTAVSAGTTYRFRTVREGSLPSQNSGRVWVEGDLARREYDAGNAYPFDENRAEVFRDGDPLVLVLSLKDRTHHRTRLTSKNWVATLALPRMPTEGTAVQDVVVSFQREAGVEAVGGRLCRRTRLVASYALTTRLSGERIGARVAATIDFWMTDLPAGMRLAFGDGAPSMTTGFPDVDLQISEWLRGVEGIAVKTLLTATRTVDGGQPITESLSRALSDFEEVAVAAARFDVPEGYRYQPPSVVEPVRADVAPHPAPAERGEAPAARPSRDEPGAVTSDRPELADSMRLLQRGLYQEAVRRLKALDQQTGGACADCLAALAAAHYGAGAYQDAAATARRLLALSPERKQLAGAYNQLGLALMALGKKKSLIEAEDAFRQALARSEGSAEVVHVNLAVALYRLKRADEARRVLDDLLAKGVSEALAARARRLLRTPRCADASCPSGVSFVTPEGETVTIEELEGKVVLVSFWATWCAPCLEAMPELVALQKRFRKDPFVIVGVNVDRERETMNGFVAERKLTWPQCWDGDNRVTGPVFGVDRFPTEILLDHEGVVVGRSSGWGRGTSDRLALAIHDLIGPARKARGRVDTPAASR
jgi:thiol-disulfide isomerase/thioredoxin